MTQEPTRLWLGNKGLSLFKNETHLLAEVVDKNKVFYLWITFLL